MSKGLSWRQHSMLRSIARRLEAERKQHERMNAALGKHGRRSKDWRARPVAWKAVDYGPTSEEDFDTPRVQWNVEQATRRALRSLERRGLVELGRYCFRPFVEGGAFSPQIVWSYVDPDDHVPGDSRVMTGVLLTEAGWAAAAEAGVKLNELAQARTDRDVEDTGEVPPKRRKVTETKRNETK